MVFIFTSEAKRGYLFIKSTKFIKVIYCHSVEKTSNPFLEKYEDKNSGCSSSLLLHFHQLLPWEARFGNFQQNWF